jgi:hypothetical protein
MTARAAAAGLTVLALAWPASAGATSQHASSGALSATITWHAADRNGPARDLHVTIVDAGRTVTDAAVRVPGLGCGGSCPPVGPLSFRHHPALTIANLDGRGPPEVVVAAYTGGAHCCADEHLYTAAGRHDAIELGNQLGTLRSLRHDGRTELVTADDFSYAFSSYADSLSPVEVLDDAGGRWVERTRRYPALVRRDLLAQRARYRDARAAKTSVRTALAAYVADLHHLGRHAQARRVLAAALARGELKRRSPEDFGPFGQAYVRVLDRMLRLRGYLR